MKGFVGGLYGVDQGRRGLFVVRRDSTAVSWCPEF